MGLFKKDNIQPAFFIATVKMKDPEKFQEYAQRASETFSKYSGEIIARGPLIETLAGEGPEHQAVGIVKFSSLEALRKWYRSPEYQSIVSLRDEASDMILATYEMPS